MSLKSGLEIDTSLVKGRSFECVDPCQLCCLCQPELLPGEESWFLQNHPDTVVEKAEPHRHLAIRMKGGGGPCVFLENRRCAVYDYRPSFCRQFPVSIYIGEKIQADLDLSCRGVWSESGRQVSEIFENLIARKIEVIRPQFLEVKAAYMEFYRNCQEAGVFREPERLRGEFSSLLERMNFAFLGNLLLQSMEEDELELDSVGETLSPKEKKELEEAMVELALQSLSAENPHSASVYCDEMGNWNIFFPEGEMISWMTMDEEGDIHTLAELDPFEVEVPLEGQPPVLMVDYAKMLNARDSMLGHVYYLMDLYGYDVYLTNVYAGVMATSLLDLWWRVNLLRWVRGRELDNRAVREGIIFYDMDRLGAPVLGVFG